MITFIFELIVIISYLFNPYLGFTLSLIYYSNIFFYKRYNFLEKLLLSLIFSIPTYNISVIGDKLHHMFSWCSILLGILMFYLIYTLIINQTKFHIKNLLLLLLFTSFIIITNFSLYFANDSVIKVIQVFLMIVPVLLSVEQADFLSEKVDKKTLRNIENNIIYTITATAVAVIFQYTIFNINGTMLGKITIYEGRIVFDLLFKAYSVLSLYMGLGIVISVKRFFKEYKIIYLVLSLIILVGIVFNSSRTGLVASLIVSLIIVLKSLKYKKKYILKIIVILIGIFIMILATNFLLNSRNTNTLMDNNGRFGTYEYSFNLIFRNFLSFLLGNGLSLSNYNEMVAHNFFMETILSSGIVVFSIVFYWCVKLLKCINRSEFKYIIWAIFIGSMFITNFQGNMFATIFFIISIIDDFFYRKVEKKNC